ncbi:MAG: polynucleotide adenylyltransferase [Acutalibacteraceae bacterium]|nr:polynucleotide adenylyltransferase [Acutalibacteraceae bacterium]
MENNIKIHLPVEVEYIIDTLYSKGYDCYAVGGCVRDSLMGKNPQDWDLTTNAPPQKTKEIFSDMETVDIGIQHGTVGIVINKKVYETTTFRSESGYEDMRHPDKVEFVSDLKEDLKRRDFTINAMAYNRKDGLVDFFHGQCDLQYKTIRCVGNSRERFSEDALRILRCLRFSSTLGFSIEPETAAGMRENAAGLKKISAERISSEFFKLICGKDAKYVLRRYKDIFLVILPEIKPLINTKIKYRDYKGEIKERTLWQYCATALGYVQSYQEKNHEYALRSAILFHCLGSPVVEINKLTDCGFETLCAAVAERIFERLRCSNSVSDIAVCLIKNRSLEVPDSKPAVKKLLNKLGYEKTFLLFDFWKCIYRGINVYEIKKRYLAALSASELLYEVVRNGECYRVRGLNINGKDLISSGVTDGKKIGDILNSLLNKVIEEEIPNEKGILIETAQEYILNN